MNMCRFTFSNRQISVICQVDDFRYDDAEKTHKTRCLADRSHEMNRSFWKNPERIYGMWMTLGILRDIYGELYVQGCISWYFQK